MESVLTYGVYVPSEGGAGKKVPFFDFDWKEQIWNLIFILGALIGGYIATNFLSNSELLKLSQSTIADLAEINIPFQGKLMPEDQFNWENLLTLKGFIIIVVGGFLVGFGTRWAGGCTSGHAISGLSNLQLPYLFAVVGFLIGGLIVTHFIFPILFNL